MARTDPDAIRRTLNALDQTGGNRTAAARRLGLNRQTVLNHLSRAVSLGLTGQPPVPTAPPVPTGPTTGKDPSAVLAALRKNPATLDAIAADLGVSRGAALDWIEAEQRRGVNLVELGGRYSVERDQPLGLVGGGRPLLYQSRPDGTYLFGAMGDTHCGSKYERLDVLNRLYERYAAAGVDRVFHAGNWIEGESRFNKYDLSVYGMDAQVRHLAAVYPRVPGVATYAVAGDDHEGWYGQREGVNIGKYAENAMRDAGRDDWHDCGYMEANFELVDARSGKSAVLALVHPGGGSAYALSYSIQKIVESYEGGSKPAVGLYGHYHKLWSGNIRNVWVVQTGTCQDQTPFMRKKRLEAHVGGYLIGLRQDPATGAIVEMTATCLRYFNQGYYNDMWSHSGPVVLPRRAVG